MLAKLKFIVPLLFLFSCIVEDDTLTIYNVKNETVYDISMVIHNFVYHESLPPIPDSIIQISANDVFSINYGGSHYPFPLGESTDSVIIIFDGSRKLIHRRNELDTYRNILNRDSYVERVNEDNHVTYYHYTYTLTEEDYNNAVPIED